MANKNKPAGFKPVGNSMVVGGTTSSAPTGVRPQLITPCLLEPLYNLAVPLLRELLRVCWD